MAAKAVGAFEVTAWDEKPYLEMADGRKLTRASVTQRFSVDIEGEGSVEWLMFYREDGTASFVAMQHVVGKIGSRSGSFVLETSGSFDGKTARASWSIVPGSGTNGLRALRGSGTYVAGHGSTGDGNMLGALAVTDGVSDTVIASEAAR